MRFVDAAASHQSEVRELQSVAQRAAVRNDTTAMTLVINTVEKEVWAQWRNKAGLDLLALAEERGSVATSTLIAQALGFPGRAEALAARQREDDEIASAAPCHKNRYYRDDWGTATSKATTVYYSDPTFAHGMPPGPARPWSSLKEGTPKYSVRPVRLQMTTTQGTTILTSIWLSDDQQFTP